MNMLKSSGLKIPGRGPKHSSPVGRTTAGSSSGPAAQKDSKSVFLHRRLERRPFSNISYHDSANPAMALQHLSIPWCLECVCSARTATLTSKY